MTETNQKIIDMILKGASTNEISLYTGLSNKQLFYRLNMLRTKGYNFSRKYYYDGEITYNLQKGFEEEKEISLITSPKDKEFKAVFISDLHLSNKDDRVDLLNEVYEFCAKEGIHIIINGGDIIDGFVGSINYKKFETAEEQIEYALKKYPFDKNILNFTCLGNHDYSTLEVSGQNLETVLNAKRHDIISLGYGIGKLKIKNDEIIVRHPKTPMIIPNENISNGFVLTGHTHESKNVIRGNLINIYLSSLSDIKMNEYSLPGFIMATIKFNNGYFNDGYFEQYVFFNKFYKVNETKYQFRIGGKEHSVIKYEEERIPYGEEKVKILKKEEISSSQIDKFNKRYSK